MKEIIIDASSLYTTVAIFENNKIVEMGMEREKGLVGNVYKGKVENILPGLEAAFVNIGEGRNAYLSTSSVLEKIENEVDIIEEETGSISKKLSSGQDILVQVVREPISTKGAKITTKISLAGRYLVLVPYLDFIGISRKIEDEKEKERLREIIREIKPSGCGIIIRTAGESAKEAEIEKDVSHLKNRWGVILENYKFSSSPSLLYSNLPIVSRILRDCLNQTVDKIIVNSIDEYEKILRFVEEISYQFKDKVVLYQGKTSLKKQYSLKKHIDGILQNKVYLKSGGHIIIERTEGLTVIDVNSGKYTGKKGFEETAFKINSEAAGEVMRQIRLRDIGGIIVVDFIDMKDEDNQKKIIERLKEEAKKDRSKVNIFSLTELGLVQITRKRIGLPLERILTRECPYCGGRGRIKEETEMF